ncbi:MAG: hypothetical protein QG560_939 [Campylobacterota bacterium]|nr:hypothetical protein [Campylobacterota bacterium]MDQ1338351.1 hypothetical protein [Campylobacterota bacterium]
MLFDEIVFMIETILHEGLEQTKQKIKEGHLYQNKYMCRAGYDLYISIESVYKAMRLSSTHYFPRDYEILCKETISFSSPKEKWEYFTNKDFMHLTQVMVEFITKAQSYHDPFCRSGYLNSFLTCKSEWYQLFAKSYRAGNVHNDMLEVSYLPWAQPRETKEWDMRAIHQATNIVVYDVSSLEKRQEIEKHAEQNIQRVKVIMCELKAFMLKHCTLDKMLNNEEIRF